MWHFVQPLFAALLGAAMIVFGAIHTIGLWPAPAVWAQVAAAAPQLLAVALVIACATLAVSGVAMLILGLRRARRRMAQLRHLRFEPEMHEPGRMHEPDAHWA